jgi:hypothetical protein
VNDDRVLRTPAQGAVSLREHLSPTGQPPPVATCVVAEPDVPLLSHSCKEMKYKVTHNF